MSPERQRIVIAEASGWTACGQTLGCEPHGYPPAARKPTVEELLAGTGLDPWDIPDYLNDLNACHEMEKVLLKGDGNWVNYVWNLGWQGASPDRRIVHATAAQRCEAFLRTLDLWEESDE